MTGDDAQEKIYTALVTGAWADASAWLEKEIVAPDAALQAETIWQIDAALEDFDHGLVDSLVGLGLSCGSSGVLRAAFLRNPEAARKSLSMRVSVPHHVEKYLSAVLPLLSCDPDVRHLSRRLMIFSLRQGYMAGVTALRAAGVALAEDGHEYPMLSAVSIDDPQKRAEMAAFLHAEGLTFKHRDVLLQAGKKLCDPAARDSMADLLALYLPDSDLPVLAAWCAEENWPAHARGWFEARYPRTRFWYDAGLVAPLFDAKGALTDCWHQNAALVDIGTDDFFLLKMAICAANDHATGMLLRRAGQSPDTVRDKPLSLAILFNKHAQLTALAESGADLYAARAEAFALSGFGYNGDALLKLQAARQRDEAQSRKKFSWLYLGGNELFAEVLRARQTDGESGYMLAARGGLFMHLLDAGFVDGMTGDDLLAPSKTGATLAHMLAARGEGHLLFDCRIWGTAPRDISGPEKVWQALPPQERARCRDAYLSLVQHKIEEERRRSLRAAHPPRRPEWKKKDRRKP